MLQVVEERFRDTMLLPVKLFADRINVIKNGHKESNDASHSGASTLAMDECHMEQVKSVFECMHSISCMAIPAEVRISPAGVYHIFTNSLGKQKVCAK